MRALMTSVIRDTRGATAIEYALIAGLIAVVIAVAVGTLGTDVKGLFNSVANAY
ncbi:MAG TPA: Flp family type IVb pilin [Stellaceae bacterium]|nr:Flp family type IVb pilin [Stellaceae bacterium]